MIVRISARTSAFIAGMCVLAAWVMCRAQPGEGSYCGMEADSYLTGRFEPERVKCFVDISTLGVPVSGARQYLRREAAEALAAMLRDFKKSHPGVELRVRSSTRTWEHQKSIWEGKWHGRVRVEGVRLDEWIPDPAERAAKILEFSSMPGTSRHHWGTDFDLQELDNSYYESGRGAVLYRWLSTNARSYGFCQPYTEGRREGYMEEKWHWSYAPLARTYLADWLRLYKKDPGRMAKESGFAGSDVCLHRAPVYVESVNPSCR